MLISKTAIRFIDSSSKKLKGVNKLQGIDRLSRLHKRQYKKEGDMDYERQWKNKVKTGS